MRISNQGLLAATVLSLFSGATMAAKAVNPDTLPKVECTSLRYSDDFLQKYPKAPAACLEARVYKGETGDDDDTIGLVNRRRVDLRTPQQVDVTHAGGGRRDPMGVGSGIRLGHRERHLGLAGGQSRQPLALLVGGSVADQELNADRARHDDHERRRTGIHF